MCINVKSNEYTLFKIKVKGGEFSKEFKKEFCPFLTDIIIEWFRADNRNDFSFETALWSFFIRTEEYRFKLDKKKFQYSPFNFFY